MSYERTNIDNNVQLLQKTLNEIQDSQETTPRDVNIGPFASSGKAPNSLGQQTGVLSTTPITSFVTDLDENGAPTGTTNRINFSSSLVVVDYSIPFLNIDLKYINFKPSPGTHVKFTPKVGRTLIIKTGGDFDIPADITISDNEYKEFIFYDATQSGIAGGAFVPAKDASGGGGFVTNPMSADLDGGGFDIFNVPTLFLNAALTQGILGNAGGVGIFAPTGDTIDFFINSLVTPKFGITETSIESNVNLHMNNKDITEWDNLTSLGGDTIADDATLGGLSMFLGASREFRIFRGAPQIAEFGNQIDFLVQQNMNNNNIAEISSLLFNVGDSIQGGASEFAFITASGDAETHYNNVTKIETIDSSGLTLHSSKTLSMLDAATADFFQISQISGITTLTYTGDLVIRESGSPIMTLAGLLISIERNIEMNNHEINNAFTIEINDNFSSGGVPTRPVAGCKLFVRDQVTDPSKKEIRAYFATGNSQLVSSEP